MRSLNLIVSHAHLPPCCHHALIELLFSAPGIKLLLRFQLVLGDLQALAPRRQGACLPRYPSSAWHQLLLRFKSVLGDLQASAPRR
eukprot:1160987-Pelagomonas_calceolata.AAC.4